MSIMEQAKSRAADIERERAQAEVDQRNAHGLYLEARLNSGTWVKEMPPAVYVGNGEAHQDDTPLWLYLFKIDDVMLGVNKTGYMTDQYFIQVECAGGHTDCEETVWVWVSKYNSAKTFTDVVAEVLSYNRYCGPCDSVRNIRPRCTTCGKPK